MRVSLRVNAEAFLSVGCRRDAFAAQFDVHLSVVGLHHAAEGRTAAHQAAFQRCLVEFGRRGPIEPGAARKTEVLGHGSLGDREALGDALVRQIALELESENVLDHAYVHALPFLGSTALDCAGARDVHGVNPI